MKLFGGVGSHNRLDFDCDPDYDADTGLSKRTLYYCGIEKFYELRWVIIREVVDEVLLIVLSGGCLISNKLFDCGAAPAHDPQPEVFKGIFFHCGK